jgi:hypoxanthine phosphoribosyltransferase
MRHSILFDEETIADRVRELAHEIREDLPDKAPVIVGLLTGSFVFLADLVRALARLGLEPRIDFIAASHYGSGTVASGNVDIVKDIGTDVSDRAVLLVDDIIDSGYTLDAVRRYVSRRGPAWLRTCVLLDKPERRQVAIDPDYIGFPVADAWLIGYGLDAGGEGRALPYVAVMSQEEPGGES